MLITTGSVAHCACIWCCSIKRTERLPSSLQKNALSLVYHSDLLYPLSQKIFTTKNYLLEFLRLLQGFQKSKYIFCCKYFV